MVGDISRKEKSQDNVVVVSVLSQVDVEYHTSDLYSWKHMQAAARLAAVHQDDERKEACSANSV